MEVRLAGGDGKAGQVVRGDAGDARDGDGRAGVLVRGAAPPGTERGKRWKLEFHVRESNASDKHRK